MKMTHPDSDLTVDVTPTAVERYESQGWRVATPDAPTGSASKAEWATYAVAQGFDADEVAAMTRAQLRAALS